MNNKINDELNKQPGNPAVMEQALKLYTRNVNFNEAFDTLIENIRKIINLNKKLGISPDFPPSEQICKIMSEFKKASFDKKNIEQYLNDKVKETFNNPTDEDKTTYIKSMKNIYNVFENLKGNFHSFQKKSYEELLSYIMVARSIFMKTSVEKDKEANANAVVAVYGARAYPIQRRVGILSTLADPEVANVNLNNGIILSGGRSWTQIVSSDKKYEPTDKEIQDYLLKEEKIDLDIFENIIKKITSNSEEITDDEIKMLATEVHKSDKLFNNVYKKYENSQSQKSFDDWLKEDYLSNTMPTDTYTQNGKEEKVISLFNPRERVSKFLKNEKFLKAFGPTHEEQSLLNDMEYMSDSVILYDFKNSIFQGASGMYELFYPDLKNLLLAEEKREWEETLLERKMQLFGVSTKLEFDDFFKNLKNKKKNLIPIIETCEKKLKENNLYGKEFDSLNDSDKKIFRRALRYIPKQYQRIIISSPTGLYRIKEFEKIKNMTYSDIERMRDEELKKRNHTLDEYLINKLAHSARESDVMDVALRMLNKKYKGQLINGISKTTQFNQEDGLVADDGPIIHDALATNSAENAINTLREFLKLKGKNSKLKKLIVVSEWPYLLRQVYTTIHQAQTNPEFEGKFKDVEIIGYPVDMNLELKTYFSEFCKMAIYPDVGYIKQEDGKVNSNITQPPTNQNNSNNSQQSQPNSNTEIPFISSAIIKFQGKASDQQTSLSIEKMAEELFEIASPKPNPKIRNDAPDLHDGR